MKTLKGRDYIEHEDGRMTFTREYLFSRGTCCGSRCLNCPFEFDKLKQDGLGSPGQRIVISMVPSWTETLILAGANVVGRTRYCLHPKDRVHEISSLGGTKSLSSDFQEAIGDLRRLCLDSAMKPLVIIDKEENPKEFEALFLDAGCEVYASHVSSLSSLESELLKMAELFPASHEIEVADNLRQYSKRLKSMLEQNRSASHRPYAKPFGFGDALLKVAFSNVGESLDEKLLEIQTGKAKLTYLIWKSPWMCVGPGTFIASVLEWLLRYPAGENQHSFLWTGASDEQRYPELDLGKIPSSTLLVYSSEPYPFANTWAKSQEPLPPGILVDGEKMSWFGIRAIRFLEDLVASLNTGRKVAD